MKLLLTASLLASAAAFAPAQQSSRCSSTAVQASSFSDAIGAQAPLGFFDPLGLVEDGNQAEFDRLRYVELKHGRVAMLAVVGYLTTLAGIRFPGAEDIKPGFEGLSQVPNMVWVQMFFTWAFMEIANRDVTGKAEFEGDFRNGWIDFGWDKQTDAWKRKKRSIELNNGRAAQMGILGIMVHEQLGNLGDILPGQ